MPRKGGKHRAADEVPEAQPQTAMTDEERLESLLARYDQQDKERAAAKPAGSQQDAMAALLGGNVVRKAELEAAQQEEKFKALVDQIFTEQGEAGVQERLRQEIAKTKKVESDLANAKKKADNAVREQEQLATEVSRVVQQRAVLENTCQHIMKETQRIREELEKRKDVDHQTREGIRTKITSEMDNLRAKLEAESETHKTTVEENVGLREEFAKLKADFDDTFKQYEQDWKIRETQTKLIVQKAQAQLEKNDVLQAEYINNQRNLDSLREATAGLRGQLDLFQAKFGDFVDASGRTQDVAKITSKQMEQLEARLAAAEKELAEQQQLKRLYDNEGNKLRTTIRQLKGKVQHAEKTKTMAEAKCREARAKAVAKQGEGKENV